MKADGMNPALIEKKTLCELIPHSGTMCLLESVEAWDSTSIKCIASDIHDTGHPLRHQDSFSAFAALELGAQSMAVHGSLLATSTNEEASPGYLAALRNVSLRVNTLDKITQPIVVEATRLMGDRRAQLYEFTVSAVEKVLVTARATVLTRM